MKNKDFIKLLEQHDPELEIAMDMYVGGGTILQKVSHVDIYNQGYLFRDGGNTCDKNNRLKNKTIIIRTKL